MIWVFEEIEFLRLRVVVVFVMVVDDYFGVNFRILVWWDMESFLFFIMECNFWDEIVFNLV